MTQKIRILGLFLVFLLLSFTVCFATENIYELPIDEEKIVLINEEWSYVKDLWILPLSQQEGTETIKLSALNAFDFANAVKQRKGTIFKMIRIPDEAIGKPLVIENGMFLENVKVYIEDQLIYEHGELGHTNKLRLLNQKKEQLIFVPSLKEFTITIQFQQEHRVPFASSKFSIGSVEASQKSIRTHIVFQTVILSLLMISFISLMIRRYYVKLRFKNMSPEIFIGLLVLKLLLSGAYPLLQIPNLTIANLDRVQIFIYVLTTMLFVYYTLGLQSKAMPILDETVKIYTIICSIVFIVMPFTWVFFWIYVHFILLTVVIIFALYANRKNLSRMHFFVLIFYVIGEILYQLGLIQTLFYLLPVLVYLIAWENIKNRDEIQIGGEVQTSEKVVSRSSKDDYEILFKNLLDTLSEGYIIVKPNLYIDAFYSKITMEYFNTEIRHQKITDLLYGNHYEDKLYVETILERYFESESLHEKKLYLELLSSDLILGDKYIHVIYEVGNNPKELIIKLIDQTKFIEVLNQTEIERKNMNMILSIIKNQKNFNQLRQAYLRFVNEEIVDLASNTENFDSFFKVLFYKLQSFNEQFKKFNMIKCCEKLDVVESELMDLKNGTLITSINALLPIILEYRLPEVLDEELLVVGEYFGDEYIEDIDAITVNQNDLKELETKILKVIDVPIRDELMSQMIKIKYTQLKKTIKNWDQYIEDYSKKLGKKVNNLVVSGHESIINDEKYSGLLKLSVQLINNAIEHGIESPSERFRKNKSEYGTLRIKVSQTLHYDELIFEDDGRGIDINGIKDVLYQQQLVPFETLVLLDQNELLSYLFKEGVSTLPGANQTNEKGLGLALLKREAERLGGIVKIETEVNQYTRIIIRINKY